ncbi:MAG: winged helix-turn-helix domain-containing protein, partial [Candidatus Hodarchaeales archaeon]
MRLGSQEKVILEVLKGKEKITISELANTVNKDLGNTHRRVMKLANLELVNT